jgi:hypothetical protein
VLRGEDAKQQRRAPVRTQEWVEDEMNAASTIISPFAQLRVQVPTTVDEAFHSIQQLAHGEGLAYHVVLFTVSMRKFLRYVAEENAITGTK